MKSITPIIRFDLGVIVTSHGADQLLRSINHSPLWYIARHHCGDWGDVSAADADVNESALIAGARLMSAYGIGSARLWIITEADRSSTTLLLPEEY